MEIDNTKPKRLYKSFTSKNKLKNTIENSKVSSEENFSKTIKYDKINGTNKDLSNKYERATAKTYHMINENPDRSVYSKRYEYRKLKEQ